MGIKRKRNRLNTKVIAWGSNVFGQCEVPDFGVEVSQVSAGCYHSLALLADNRVVSWGGHEEFQVPDFGEKTIVKISAGGAQFGSPRNIVLFEDGTILEWGETIWLAAEDHPREAPDFDQKIIDISCGGEVSYVVLEDGTIQGWGSNQEEGMNIPSFSKKAVAVSAGIWDGMALFEDGSIETWGTRFEKKNAEWLTATETKATKYQKISAGHFYAAALLEDGTPVVTNQGEKYWQRDEIFGTKTKFKDIACGSFHCALVHDDGKISAVWGLAESGEGDVPEFQGKAVQVSAGDEHTVALIEL